VKKRGKGGELNARNLLKKKEGFVYRLKCENKQKRKGGTVEHRYRKENKRGVEDRYLSEKKVRGEKKKR